MISGRAVEMATLARSSDLLDAAEVSFVMCLEANRLQSQGILLCESIRRFGGAYAKSRILGVSPRPELALGAEARARFRELDVTYVDEPLNLTGHPYGTINRVVVGAWAETQLDSSYLAILDTDMVFTAEPRLRRADVGARPVDMKGSASAGYGDPLDNYWLRICSIAGVSLDELPILRTTVGNQLIRASYNGGFTVVRRGLGILEHTRHVFFRAMAEDLRPLVGLGLNVKASTGLVGTVSSEWWGSSQSALSAAIWAKTRDVYLYGPAYNIPLHLLTDGSRDWPLDNDSCPILLHYHYLTEPQYRREFSVVLARIGCAAPTVEWLRTRLHMFDVI